MRIDYDVELDIPLPFFFCSGASTTRTAAQRQGSERRCIFPVGGAAWRRECASSPPTLRLSLALQEGGSLAIQISGSRMSHRPGGAGTIWMIDANRAGWPPALGFGYPCETAD